MLTMCEGEKLRIQRVRSRSLTDLSGRISEHQFLDSHHRIKMDRPEGATDAEPHALNLKV
jgi:hypothetical protein